MHIEIGIIDSARLTAANVGTALVVATQARHLVRAPFDLAKTALAAVVFSVLMQIWHQPVGPSELHLIGATTVYLLFGFVPTIVGFAIGLLMQGLLFEPQDLLHLGVNSLSLMLPLVAVHASYGRRLFAAQGGERFSYARVLRLDAVYYAGVTAMVGFWLSISNDATAIADFAAWALAYVPVFAAEATLTFGTVALLARYRANPALQHLTDLGRLRFA
jgi:cobalt/nickel transport system permease protein